MAVSRSSERPANEGRLQRRLTARSVRSQPGIVTLNQISPELAGKPKLKQGNRGIGLTSCQVIFVPFRDQRSAPDRGGHYCGSILDRGSGYLNRDLSHCNSHRPEPIYDHYLARLQVILGRQVMRRRETRSSRHSTKSKGGCYFEAALCAEPQVDRHQRQDRQSGQPPPRPLPRWWRARCP